MSLVFKDIIENDVEEYEAVDHVKSSPSSLRSLYDRLMAKVEGGSEQDQVNCRLVLIASCLAYRPLSRAELHAVAGLPVHVRSEGHCSEMWLFF